MFRFRLLSSLLLLSIMTVFSCQGPGGNAGSGGGTVAPNTKTLAELVTDDYINDIQSANFSRAVTSVKLSSDDVATIRSSIQKKVASDDCTTSTDAKAVLKSVMGGISLGVKQVNALHPDNAVASKLLSIALKSTATSIKNNISKVEGKVIVVIQIVVKTGMDDLADLATKDPTNAGIAIKDSVVDVAASLKGIPSDKGTAEDVLKTLVTTTTQVAVEKSKPEMVQSAFEGVGQSTTDQAVVSNVIQDAMVKAKGDAVAVDATTAGDLLKQAVAGLGDKVTETQAGKLVDDAATTLANQPIACTLTNVTEIKAVAAEVEPTATLEATADGAALTDDLAWKAGGWAIALKPGYDNALVNATLDATNPDGTPVVLTNNTFNAQVPGAYIFTLKVVNKVGMKSCRSFLVIRIKAKPEETAPTPVLTVKEGSTAVTGDLPWTAAGHTLTLDTTASQGEGALAKLVFSTSDVVPVDNHDGTYTVSQATGSVTYTLVVTNVGGLKSKYVSKTVTIAAESAPTAVLTVKEGSTTVTGALPWAAAGRTLTLDTTASHGVGSLVQAVTSDSADATPVETSAGSGVYTVTQKTGTVHYTLVVTNVGGTKKTTVVQTVTVSAEAAPAAVLTIKNGSTVVSTLPFKEGGYTLTLDLTGSALSGTTATVTADEAPTTLTDNGNGTWTATGVKATTVFTLTVSNTGGVKSTQVKKTLAVGLSASADVQAGLAFLASKDYNSARASFTSALLKDSTDNDARIWSALLDLAALSVHADVVDLMKNRIGVVDYPAANDLNTMISDKWLKSLAYNTRTGITLATGTNRGWLVRGKLVAVSSSDYYSTSVDYYDKDYHYYSVDSYNGQWVHFVPDNSGDIYGEYWYESPMSGPYVSKSAGTYLSENPGVPGYTNSYNLVDLTHSQLFPTIAPVDGYMAFDASGQPDGYNMADWSRLLMVNVLSRNPAGFNTAVDQVLAGPYGSGLTSIATRLNAVDDSYRTVVPANLYQSQVPASATLPSVVSLGKAELLLLLSSLDVQKAFLQYLASVNLNYPISSAIVAAMKSTTSADVNKNGIDDKTEAVWASTPGVYFSTVLTERNAASRAASKATFLGALSQVKSALTLYQAALDDDTSYYRTSINTVLGNTTTDLSPSKNALANAQTALTKVTAAITNNTSLVVPNGPFSSPNQLIGSTLVWPDAGAAETTTVNPGALWAENALDLRKWLLGDSTNGFTYYICPDYTNGIDMSAFVPKVLPANRNLLTRAFFGIDLSDASKYRRLSLKIETVMNNDMVKKFYPAFNPTGPVSGPFASYWDALYSGGYSNGVYTYNEFYKPDANAEGNMAWLNKK